MAKLKEKQEQQKSEPEPKKEEATAVEAEQQEKAPEAPVEPEQPVVIDPMLINEFTDFELATDYSELKEGVDEVLNNV